MLGKLGVDQADISAAAETADAILSALRLMSEALAQLDSDNNIPALIGAHLQSAIDALWTSTSGDQLSIHLH